VLEQHAALHRSHETTLAELKQRNEWAARLNLRWRRGGPSIRRLQEEAAIL